MNDCPEYFTNLTPEKGKTDLEELEEAFPNLDIYSQCSSYDPGPSMAARRDSFFKDGIR